MLEKLKRNISFYLNRLKFIPSYYIFTAAIMICGAIVIRITTKNPHLVYSALDNRGIFPSAFSYMIFYFLRLIMSSLITAYYVFSRRIYEERAKTVILTVATAVMMLLEYKLIFGGVSLLLAIFFSLLSPVCAVYSFLILRCKEKITGIITVIYSVLQLIFLFQLVSLAICL